MQSNELLSIKIGQTVQKLEQSQFTEAKLTSTKDENLYTTKNSKKKSNKKQQIESFYRTM